MNKYLLAGTAAAVLIGGSAAIAQVAHPAHGAHGAHMAQVKSRADVQTGVAKMFARVDANKDGFVTQDEMKAAHKGKRGHGHGK